MSTSSPILDASVYTPSYKAWVFIYEKLKISPTNTVFPPPPDFSEDEREWIISFTQQLNELRKRYRIDNSVYGGLGLFAINLEVFLSGEMYGDIEWTLWKIPKGISENAYNSTIDIGKYKDTYVMGGPMSLVNHSCEAKLKFHEDKKTKGLTSYFQVDDDEGLVEVGRNQELLFRYTDYEAELKFICHCPFHQRKMHWDLFHKHLSRDPSILNVFLGNNSNSLQFYSELKGDGPYFQQVFLEAKDSFTITKNEKLSSTSDMTASEIVDNNIIEIDEDYNNSNASSDEIISVPPKSNEGNSYQLQLIHKKRMTISKKRKTTIPAIRLQMVTAAQSEESKISTINAIDKHKKQHKINMGGPLALANHSCFSPIEFAEVELTPLPKNTTFGVILSDNVVKDSYTFKEGYPFEICYDPEVRKHLGPKFENEGIIDTNQVNHVKINEILGFKCKCKAHEPNQVFPVRYFQKEEATSDILMENDVKEETTPDILKDNGPKEKASANTLPVAKDNGPKEEASADILMKNDNDVEVKQEEEPFAENFFTNVYSALIVTPTLGQIQKVVNYIKTHSESYNFTWENFSDENPNENFSEVDKSQIEPLLKIAGNIAKANEKGYKEPPKLLKLKFEKNAPRVFSDIKKILTKSSSTDGSSEGPLFAYPYPGMIWMATYDKIMNSFAKNYKLETYHFPEAEQQNEFKKFDAELFTYNSSQQIKEREEKAKQEKIKKKKEEEEEEEEKEEEKKEKKEKRETKKRKKNTPFDNTKNLIGPSNSVFDTSSVLARSSSEPPPSVIPIEVDEDTFLHFFMAVESALTLRPTVSTITKVEKYIIDNMNSSNLSYDNYVKSEASSSTSQVNTQGKQSQITNLLAVANMILHWNKNYHWVYPVFLMDLKNQDNVFMDIKNIVRELATYVPNSRKITIVNRTSSDESSSYLKEYNEIMNNLATSIGNSVKFQLMNVEPMIKITNILEGVQNENAMNTQKNSEIIPSNDNMELQKTLPPTTVNVNEYQQQEESIDSTVPVKKVKGNRSNKSGYVILNNPSESVNDTAFKKIYDNDTFNQEMHKVYNENINDISIGNTNSLFKRIHREQLLFGNIFTRIKRKTTLENERTEAIRDFFNNDKFIGNENISNPNASKNSPKILELANTLNSNRSKELDGIYTNFFHKQNLTCPFTLGFQGTDKYNYEIGNFNEDEINSVIEYEISKLYKNPNPTNTEEKTIPIIDKEHIDIVEDSIVNEIEDEKIESKKEGNIDDDNTKGNDDDDDGNDLRKDDIRKDYLPLKLRNAYDIFMDLEQRKATNLKKRVREEGSSKVHMVSIRKKKPAEPPSSGSLVSSSGNLPPSSGTLVSSSGNLPPSSNILHLSSDILHLSSDSDDDLPFNYEYAEKRRRIEADINLELKKQKNLFMWLYYICTETPQFTSTKKINERIEENAKLIGRYETEMNLIKRLISPVNNTFIDKVNSNVQIYIHENVDKAKEEASLKIKLEDYINSLIIPQDTTTTSDKTTAENELFENVKTRCEEMKTQLEMKIKEIYAIPTSRWRQINLLLYEIASKRNSSEVMGIIISFEKEKIDDDTIKSGIISKSIDQYITWKSDMAYKRFAVNNWMEEANVIQSSLTQSISMNTMSSNENDLENANNFLDAIKETKNRVKKFYLDELFLSYFINEIKLLENNEELQYIDAKLTQIQNYITNPNAVLDRALKDSLDEIWNKIQERLNVKTDMNITLSPSERFIVNKIMINDTFGIRVLIPFQLEIKREEERLQKQRETLEAKKVRFEDEQRQNDEIPDAKRFILENDIRKDEDIMKELKRKLPKLKDIEKNDRDTQLAMFNEDVNRLKEQIAYLEENKDIIIRDRMKDNSISDKNKVKFEKLATKLIDHQIELHKLKKRKEIMEATNKRNVKNSIYYLLVSMSVTKEYITDNISQNDLSFKLNMIIDFWINIQHIKKTMKKGEIATEIDNLFEIDEIKIFNDNPVIKFMKKYIRNNLDVATESEKAELGSSSTALMKYLKDETLPKLHSLYISTE